MQCFVLDVLSNEKTGQKQYILGMRNGKDAHLESKTVTMEVPVVAFRHLPGRLLSRGGGSLPLFTSSHSLGERKRTSA